MAGRDGKSSDGIMTWVFISLMSMGLMAWMVWLVASHMIVYYGSPIVDAMAFPWRLLPKEIGGSVVADLDFNYILFRKHPAHIALGDWVSYCNTALRPWAVLFILVSILLFLRQTKRVKSRQLNEKMTPESLARQMVNVFTDIAPVVEIQKKLVANELPRWERQKFPEEFLRGARYQQQSVLVDDVENEGALVVDEARLRGYLEETKTYKHAGKVLLRSRMLGRQIVDIVQDAKSDVQFPDRLTDAGKAIFAILAPYAFGSAKGKVQSKEVSDALNMSAYGSPQGMANLAIPEVEASFQQWRTNPLAKRLAKIYHWENTFLFALLEHAQRSGKIGTWNFIWLKPTDRYMFYALNTVGRKTPHSESGLAFSQHQFERKSARKGRLPLTRAGKPVIFSKRVIEALKEEWDHWCQGEDDADKWWLEDDLQDWQSNSELMSSLSAINNVPLPPALAQ